MEKLTPLVTLTVLHVHRETCCAILKKNSDEQRQAIGCQKVKVTCMTNKEWRSGAYKECL